MKSTLWQTKNRANLSVGGIAKFTTPSRRSMTLIEAENWLQTELAKLDTMIDTKLSLERQVEEASKLERLLIEGAEAALKYAEDTALLRSWHPTTPIERLRSEIPNLSADAELEQVLQRITEFHKIDRTVTLPDGVKAVRRTELEAVCFRGDTFVYVEDADNWHRKNLSKNYANRRRMR